MKIENAFKFLRKNVDTITKKIGLKVSEEQRMKFDYFIYRDFTRLKLIGFIGI